MKIYIYPVTDGHLAALTIEPDAVIGELKFTPPIEENEAVLMLRDQVREYPNGPHQMAWVADPHSHPDVAAALDRLCGPPDDQLPDESGKELCSACVHHRVCSAASEAERVGATITACEMHVHLPEETTR